MTIRRWTSLPGLWLLLLTSLFSGTASASHSTNPATNSASFNTNQRQQCLRQIDQAVSLHRTTQSAKARQLLLSLQVSCKEIPQLWHNLAVYAAKDKRWKAAGQLLEQSLALDKRASHSWTALQAIYGHRSALTYRSALGLQNTRLPQQPVLELQSSDLSNHSQCLFDTDIIDAAQRDGPRPQNNGLDKDGPRSRQLPAANAANRLSIEHRLMRWWNAQIDGDQLIWRASYSAQAFIESDKTATSTGERWRQVSRGLPVWEEVVVELEYTQTDVIALLNFSVDQKPRQKMVLLHQQNSEWQIYRERHL